MRAPWRVEMFRPADAKWLSEGSNHRSKQAATAALTKLRTADAGQPGSERKIYRIRRAS
jgi:hypothetical protein